MFEEANDICQKVVYGTNLQYHDFPCINCTTHFRGTYGGETLVDALIDLEQAARQAHVVPDKSLDEREAEEARTNPEVEEIERAKRQI